jgi:hypothetical protein
MNTQSEDETFEFSNQELIAVMQALAERETPEALLAFHQMLAGSQLLLPAPLPSPSTEQAEEEEDIPLLTFENDAGAWVLVAFTDEDAALSWAPDDTEFVALRGLDLLLIAVRNDIDELLLNPGAAHARRIPRKSFEAIALQGALERPGDPAMGASSGTTVLIAPPVETPPEDWWRVLSEVLEHYPSVESAYFFQLRMAPQGARHVIGVALYEGMSVDAQETLMHDLTGELKGMLPIGWTLDLVVLDDADFLTTVRDTVVPFYEQD